MPSSTEFEAPSFADIGEAARRLKGLAVATPLLESSRLNAELGLRLLIKPEMLQRTGSFKFRGAYNALALMGPEAKERGVVGYSSGNHGQGVAAAAQILGIPATIVMPEDAPAVKVAGTRAYGAEIVFYDRYHENRTGTAERVAAERGALLERSYEDPNVIAGQGTVGLEIGEQAAELGLDIDAVLVPCGGGGLVAGSAIALAETTPAAAVYAVEPEDFDDTARSLASGRRQANPPEARSVCDGLLAPKPGALTFTINARLLAGGFTVGDGEALAAMATLFQHFKVVAEPSGAVAAAAVIKRAADWRTKTVVAVATGGNVEAALYREALEKYGAACG